MGMCKGCKEVFSALEMQDGYCKECKTHEDKPKVEPKPSGNNSELIKTVVYGVVALVFVVFVVSVMPKSKKIEGIVLQEPSTKERHSLTVGDYYGTRRDTIGCEDKNELYTAIREFRHGGLTALMPYVVGNAKCLYIPNKNVRLIKMTDFAYLIYFDNPDGDSRFLWIDEDEIH